MGEVMLQRTRGENAAATYIAFVREWPTAEALAEASVRQIEEVIRPLGLPKRAVMLRALAERLVQLGAVPRQPEQLMDLPGVGPYAAHSVQVYARGRNLPVVDWVIARVLRRYFGLPQGLRPNSDHELWRLAGRLAAKGRARDLWFGVFDLAAGVCKPNPLCGECPLRGRCSAAHRLAAGQSPGAPPCVD